MSVAKVTEVISSSTKGFDDAAWVKDQNVVVEKGKITEYRVSLKVTFILKD